MKTRIILKEEINNLIFLKREIIYRHEKKTFMHQLPPQEETLGNNYKHKIKIVFLS